MIMSGVCFVFNERSKVAQIGLKSNYVVGFLGKKDGGLLVLHFIIIPCFMLTVSVLYWREKRPPK